MRSTTTRKAGGLDFTAIGGRGGARSAPIVGGGIPPWRDLENPNYKIIQLKEEVRMKSNKLKQDVFKGFLFFLIILIFVALNSCSTTGSRTIAPENRIPVVADKPQLGTWESQHVVLEYEFVKEGGYIGLIIDGRARRWLEQLVVWVLFLDDQGKVLERETVFNSGFRSKRTKARRMQGTIERAFEVPKGTKYMAFQSLKQPYRGSR
jgi:hypothetical protein